MSKYQTMPALSEEDAIALEKDIRERGMQVPILLDEDGEIIDGHHRWEIAQRLGIPARTEVREGLTEAEKVAMSISLNVARRQLSRQQKHDVIAASLTAEPEASNREHARRTGVNHETVQKVRDELESTGGIRQLDKTRGADGKERPAAHPVVSLKTKTTEETTETYDPQTGEVLEPSSAEVAIASAEGSQRLQDSRYVTAFVKSLVPLGSIWAFDAERVGHLADREVIEALRGSADTFEKFVKRVERAASWLRVLEGGAQ